jgi:hypothetical protein
MLLVSYLRNHYLIQDHYDFSKSFILLAFTFRSLIHFELFFNIWCEVGIQLHSFTMGYSVVPALFVKKNIPFSMNCSVSLC